MICRLCLTNLNIKQAVQLFETPTNETKLIKMIAKFFYLKISHDDDISTKICQKCRDHLEDFHEFWTYVHAKQSTLKEETHMGVKRDVETQPCVEFVDNGKGDDWEKQDEIPLDIKSIQMPLEVCFNESIMETPKTDRSPLGNDVMHDALDIATDNYCSTDDDLPLLQLRTKVKKKKAIVRDASKQQVSDKSIKTQRNIDIINEAMDLSCDLCKASIEGYAQLRSHFSEKHDCPPYVICCGKSFQKPSTLIQHINWHNSLFKCDICGKELRSEHRLIVHREKFHSIKTDKVEQLRCTKCNKGFTSETRLQKHLSACSSEQVFACSICKKEYFSEKWLQNHIITRHEHGTETNFNCKSCGKIFPTVQRMQKHIEAIHEKVYYHVCDVCGKQFRFKPSFEKHVLEHQGIVEPTMQCHLCGEWLKNAQALRLHQFKHDTVNVKCQYCGKICISRKALVGHINYMHKPHKTLQCKYCEKTFKQSRNLDEHMAIHTGAQLYSCPHCTKECRSRSNMYVHIKRSHVQEWLESKAARSNDPNLNVKLQNQDQTESSDVTF